MWNLTLILTACVLLAAPVDAATVILTDGSVLKGDVVSGTSDSITVDTLFGRVTLARTDLLHTDADSAASPGASAPVSPPALADSYSVDEDRAITALVAHAWGAQVASTYRAMTREEKARFLDTAFSRRSRLFVKYYLGYHLGRRHYTVSPAYFERANTIPRRYRSNFPALHPDDVREAADLVRVILEHHPHDAVAHCALGYLHLELDEVEAAIPLFRKAIRRNRRFVEARNGRALAHVRMHHQKSRAIKLFRETVAMDRSYVGALYGMGMCHIAMMGQDRVGLDDYFGKIIAVDPNHEDAWFKLGAFNEALRRMDRAAEAYSRQLAVNPSHRRASERLAQVSMMLEGVGDPHLTHDQLARLAERDPVTYLPLLADSHVRRREFADAEAVYERYIPTLPPEERGFYHDLSLIADPETVRAIDDAWPREARSRLIREFWVLADPTPTTPVNERRVEHFRRVYHARSSYAEGLDRLSGLGWDRRGDVYVRFGEPDHRSWSDFLVFETDPDVAKVKNRINHLAHDALIEVLPPRHLHAPSVTGAGPGQVSADVRGIPTFPLPRRTTIMSDGVESGYEWESWIYGSVGGGFEITFIDEIGKGFYEFARVPDGSPNRLLWQTLEPSTVVARVASKEPSVYAFDHGGTPIDLFVGTAGFRGEAGTDFELYYGVRAKDVADGGRADIEFDVVYYDADWTPAARRSGRVEHVFDGEPDGLVVDQVDTDIRPGEYFVAIQVRQPRTGALQIYRGPVTVPGFAGRDLGVSDLQVAGRVVAGAGRSAGKFAKGGFEVVPYPGRHIPAGKPVSLYFEIYGLARDAFGKTRYRVDYEVETSDSGLSIVSTLGRLVGRGPGEQTSRVSYEHEGDAHDERMHVDLTLPPASGSAVRVTVRVTDLVLEDGPTVARSVELTVAE